MLPAEVLLVDLDLVFQLWHFLECVAQLVPVRLDVGTQDLSVWVVSETLLDDSHFLVDAVERLKAFDAAR